MEVKKPEIITLDSIDDKNASALPYNLLLAEKKPMKKYADQNTLEKYFVDKKLGVPVMIESFRKNIVRIKL